MIIKPPSDLARLSLEARSPVVAYELRISTLIDGKPYTVEVAMPSDYVLQGPEHEERALTHMVADGIKRLWAAAEKVSAT